MDTSVTDWNQPAPGPEGHVRTGMHVEAWVPSWLGWTTIWLPLRGPDVDHSRAEEWWSVGDGEGSCQALSAALCSIRGQSPVTPPNTVVVKAMPFLKHTGKAVWPEKGTQGLPRKRAQTIAQLGLSFPLLGPKAPALHYLGLPAPNLCCWPWGEDVRNSDRVQEGTQPPAWSDLACNLGRATSFLQASVYPESIKGGGGRPERDQATL